MSGRRPSLGKLASIVNPNYDATVMAIKNFCVKIHSDSVPSRSKLAFSHCSIRARPVL